MNSQISYWNLLYGNTGGTSNLIRETSFLEELTQAEH